MRLWVVALALLLVTAPLRAVAEPAWQPKQTYALMIGILEWKDRSLASFPKQNRQDRALERALKANGVPADHIVFLEDRQATLTAIRAAMGRVVAMGGPDSTLLVYFAGHGTKDGGRTYLTNYDVDTKRLAATGLAVDEIGERLLKEWKGSRVLLMADCCHSGALSQVVTTVGSAGKAAACLTSATATNTSTGRWTFTEAVVRALTGDGRLDRNGDRRLTFGEVDAYIHNEMKYAEDQLTGAVRAGGFSADWQVTTVPAAKVVPHSAVQSRWTNGDYADVFAENKWWRAQLLRVEGHRLQVHYLGWEDKFDEWVSPDRVRPVANSRFAAGQPIKVEWEETWYPARILRSAEGFFHFVHYDGFGAEWDEWVTDRRIRPAAGG